MTAAALVRSARNRVERLFDALTNPARRERTMLAVLTGYLAIWSLYATIAKSSQDIHTDMGEVVAWSREVGLGTPKHPPLAAWLVRAWFTVFPRQDWAYYLFAILLATVALWIAWRLAGRYLPPDKRVVGIALLTFVPFYNFHAIKFNINTVLTSLWALATWWFLVSFETRRVGWAILAGVGAAAAMLGKYWSVTLLAGLGLAALTDPRRNAYFSSPAPYVTLAVGTILLTPNIYWLTTHLYMPFRYAMEAHSAEDLPALLSAFLFIPNSLAYLAAPIVLNILPHNRALPQFVTRCGPLTGRAAPGCRVCRAILIRGVDRVIADGRHRIHVVNRRDDASAGRSAFVASGCDIASGRGRVDGARLGFSLAHAGPLAAGRIQRSPKRRAELQQRLSACRTGCRAYLARIY